MNQDSLLKGLSPIVVAAALACAVVQAGAADAKPNILVIWGDDIGTANISAYSDERRLKTAFPILREESSR